MVQVSVAVRKLNIVHHLTILCNSPGIFFSIDFPFDVIAGAAYLGRQQLHHYIG